MVAVLVDLEVVVGFVVVVERVVTTWVDTLEVEVWTDEVGRVVEVGPVVPLGPLPLHPTRLELIETSSYHIVFTSPP